MLEAVYCNIPEENQGASRQEQSSKLCELESQVRKLYSMMWQGSGKSSTCSFTSTYKVPNERRCHCHTQRSYTNNKPRNVSSTVLLGLGVGTRSCVFINAGMLEVNLKIKAPWLVMVVVKCVSSERRGQMSGAMHKCLTTAWIANMLLNSQHLQLGSPKLITNCGTLHLIIAVKCLLPTSLISQDFVWSVPLNFIFTIFKCYFEVQIALLDFL